MGRTKKASTKQDKTKTKRNKKEEDLEDLYSDSDSDSYSDSETGSETGSETDEYEGTFDDMKDYDMTMPMFGIGIGIIAILGFAIYKGSAV